MSAPNQSSLWKCGVGLCFVYLGSVVLTSRYFGSDVYGEFAIAFALGVVLFVPILLGTLLLWGGLRVAVTSLPVEKRVSAASLFRASALLVLIASCLHSCLPMRLAEKQEAFERFLGARTGTLEVIDYGYRKQISTDGYYVLVFRLPREDFHALLNRESYVPARIDSDEGNWRLSLCNSMIKRLTQAKLQLDQGFDCYSKETKQTSARIFYKESDGLAVFIGSGKFRKRLQKIADHAN